MRLDTSKNISLLIGVIATAIIVLIFEVLQLSLLVKIVFVFLVTAAISYWLIKKYITKRIELLYRTIHNQKLDALNDFNLEKSEEDVKQWVSERQAEFEHLKDTEQFRREFLGNVSHELKTPIFSIQSYVLTLLDGALEDEEINRKYLMKTQKSVERMISIVEDLESISKLETNEEQLKLEKFDIVESCSAMIETLEDKAKNNTISIEFDKEYKPIWVMADAQKIKQVLTNLLDNSIKYGNENGLTKVHFFDMDDLLLVEVSSIHYSDKAYLR